MRVKPKANWPYVIVVLILAVGINSVVSDPARAAVDKTGWYSKIVDIDYVKQYAVIPKRNDVMIIDSRPTARKYDKGHIPGAISIPDSQFSAKTKLLPKDKSMLLVFYCGGEKCKLSHKSAYKAEKLGYSNIGVYAAGYPDWIKSGNLASVSAAHIKKLIDKKSNVVIVDSRPKKRKYDRGHIPTAISIPDSQFGEMRSQLGSDKNTPLIFYCGGYKCKLSSNSARKAKKLGYTNVKTFAAGFPAWKKTYGKTGAAKKDKKVTIKHGKEEGTISIASFKDILKNNPESVFIIDVRDADEYKIATLKTAVNIPINKLEGKIDSLPLDKPIVFICGTGGRSGEAYDMVRMFRNELTAYFLDAELTFNKDGSYKIEPSTG